MCSLVRFSPDGLRHCFLVPSIPCTTIKRSDLQLTTMKSGNAPSKTLSLKAQGKQPRREPPASKRKSSASQPAAATSSHGESSTSSGSTSSSSMEEEEDSSGDEQGALARLRQLGQQASASMAARKHARKEKERKAFEEGVDLISLGATVDNEKQATAQSAPVNSLPKTKQDLAQKRLQKSLERLGTGQLIQQDATPSGRSAKRQRQEVSRTVSDRVEALTYTVIDVPLSGASQDGRIGLVWPTCVSQDCKCLTASYYLGLSKRRHLFQIEPDQRRRFVCRRRCSCQIGARNATRSGCDPTAQHDGPETIFSRQQIGQDGSTRLCSARHGHFVTVRTKTATPS